MYRIWYSTESFADFIIDNTNLSKCTDIIKNKLYESDANNPDFYCSNEDSWEYGYNTEYLHSCEGGGKGVLIQDNKSATLGCSNDQTLFIPTAYGICSKDSNAMKSENPNSGFYKAETSRTPDTSDQSPNKNQGGIAVVCVDMGGGKPSCGISTDMTPTLSCTHGGEPAVCVQSDYKDPPTVNDTDDEMEYIVRRLTPTECARLQGFPDFWCSDLSSENPTNDEIAKWREIFREYDEAMGKKTKPKTDNQIRKWLQNPHSDSAEYKMWGNGISLPVVFFVLAGIAYYDDKD